MRSNVRTILGDDIFRTLERYEINQPYYTTLTNSNVLAKSGEYHVILKKVINEFSIKKNLP